MKNLIDLANFFRVLFFPFSYINISLFTRNILRPFSHSCITSVYQTDKHQSKEELYVIDPPMVLHLRMKRDSLNGIVNTRYSEFGSRGALSLLQFDASVHCCPANVLIYRKTSSCDDTLRLNDQY